MTGVRNLLAVEVAVAALLLFAAAPVAFAGERMDRYYAHEAVADGYGVIAPWYQGLNGQFDERVRVAAETLKRYPWVDTDTAPLPAPGYVYSGHWAISPQGAITLPDFSDWDTGDFGQRAAWTLDALVDYYAYSGDAAAIAHMGYLADTMLALFQTGPDNPWPSFLISVPTQGPPYAAPDPHGMIQLDIVAQVGRGLTRAAQVAGRDDWMDAARHWAHLIAVHRFENAHNAPWNRYANPEDVWWSDRMTGGVAMLLAFFDELIRAGYTGEDGELLEARDAGEAYLRENLLPRWTRHDAWGRHYWDWENWTECEVPIDYATEHFMDRQDAFPGWRDDVPALLTLFMNRASVYSAAGANTYHGAWAYSESGGCCGRSLSYAPQELAPRYARFAALTGSTWAREMARRQIILATYDFHENGVVEDNIDGGQIVTGAWSKIAVQMALDHVLEAMAWMPGILGPNRENHIVRTASTVTSVVYDDGRIRYTTCASAPPAIDVLRLAFPPDEVRADEQALPYRDDTAANGYVVESLPNGDCILTVRHDGATRVEVLGEDPQESAGEERASYEGTWRAVEDPAAEGGRLRATAETGASAAVSFTGNQVRVLGSYGPGGGLADVYLDAEKQLVPIDCYLPAPRHRQTLYARSGLPSGPHELRLVARGEGNPVSGGGTLCIDSFQWSSAGDEAGYGSGGGPRETQRFIFGRPEREGYTDSEGRLWRPGMEFVAPIGALKDIVREMWTTEPRRIQVSGTDDPELYAYGIHGGDFTVNVTVGPGDYYVRPKFAETRAFSVPPAQRAFSIYINGKTVVENVDIAATAAGNREPEQLERKPYAVWAGGNTAVDLVFNGITPRNGVIGVRFAGLEGEAIVQALEVGLGDGGRGANPVVLPGPTAEEETGPLSNPGFEQGVPEVRAARGAAMQSRGWHYVVPSDSESYFYAESLYDEYPALGLPEFHGGKEALRTHTSGDGRTIAYQDATVEPGVTYTASVWVKAADVTGGGFGAAPGDCAALRIQELVDGVTLSEHAATPLKDAGPYRQLALTFTTGPDTRTVRFVLDTHIAGDYTQGHVTYDDCSLAPAAP